MISAEENDWLTKPEPDFVDFLLSGPEWPADVLDAIDDSPKDVPRDYEW